MIKYVILFILLFVSAILGQDPVDLQLRKNRSALDNVKKEIESIKKEIQRADIKSSSALDQIKSIDRELSLIGKAKRLLRNEVRLLNNKVSGTREKLDIRQNKLSHMRAQYQKRVVHLYKRGNVQDIMLLLESASINQSLVRLKYYKFFADQERRLLNSIKNEVAQIQMLEKNLTSQRIALQQSIDEKNRQETGYLSRKNEKKVLINRLQWNRKNLNEQLSDAETEYQKLISDHPGSRATAA